MPTAREESSTRLGEGASIYQVRCWSSFPDFAELTRYLSRWKYVLFVAIDANFRLKRKAVSSDTADPSLNAGWAYFVHEDSYKSYLADRASDKQEVSNMFLMIILNLDFFCSEARV